MSTATVAGLFAAAVLPLSAASHAASSCTAVEPASANSSANLAMEGAGLLHAIQEDAYDVRNHADLLLSFERSPNLSWNTHAAELGEVRKEVNDIGRNLCRLAALRSNLPEWQQTAIARAELSSREMANYTSQALQYLNAHQDRVTSPEYNQYTRYLYDKAGQLSASLADFEMYAKASSQEARLEQTLGLKKGD